MASEWFTTLTVLLPLLTVQPCLAADTLRLGESISSNETLLSSTGTFVLGFFSPSDSPSRSYLGIWRKGSPVRTAIWVANRSSPVPLPSAIFRLSNTTSNLEVADSNGTVLWSSGIPTSTSDVARGAVGVLLDSGNLKLHNGDVTTPLWQSFDHGTNTVLMKMPVWANYRTHTAATAVSWRTPEDPSPGEFILSLDPDTPFQVIITRRGQGRWWRSNIWKGAYSAHKIANTTPMTFVYYVNTPEWFNVSFVSPALLSDLVLRLDYNGSVNLWLWHRNLKVWSNVYKINAAPCESYGSCGPFACCNSHVYKQVQVHGWVRAPWGRERVREEGRFGVRWRRVREVRGREAAGLQRVPEGGGERERVQGDVHGKLLLLGVRVRRSVDVFGETIPRCVVWFTELIDVVLRYREGGEDLYVRVHQQSNAERKKGAKLVFVVVPIVSGLVLAGMLTCLVWKWKIRRGSSKREVEIIEVREDGISPLNGFGRDAANGRPDVRLMDYETIASVTNNFSDIHKIGHGGFGNVYKGTLPRGQEVAIKRLSKESCQGLTEFTNEVALIAQLRHRNLVKLLYYCIYREEKLLIYEYMQNKSLELLLFDTENQRLLEWKRHVNIIKGVARGLLYLHEGSRLKVIHRDLKASNILLDRDMNPKISDFGMARLFEGNQNIANTRRIVGTYGYMSPEYAKEGAFSTKSDVYSFGVLVLEITSGRRNASFHSDGAFPSLLSYAWESWNSRNLTEMVAPSMQNSCSMDEVTKCIHIGLLCVQDDLTKRPTMSSVLFMFENEAPIASLPEKPNFTGWTLRDESTQ